MTETDEKLDLKANIADIADNYSKIEDDKLLLLKADMTQLIDQYSKNETYARDEVYTKSEDVALLLLKADKSELIDSYSKTETNILLNAKTNKTDLANYVDLTSVQIISGQKQFEIIRVLGISKQSKNDAFILLAGEREMLVSSFVTQSQLLEVGDIATGKSKAYVFSTQEELNDQIVIQDNVAKLAIADNLYTVDKEETDYCNAITILGAATRGGNATNDKSIDRITLTPAENIAFVTIGNDQSIFGMKTFISTIFSNGIQYFGYGNNSVFLASGGVRSIADIQSASYTKSEDDTLLQLKADKTQLIDSYSKSETYARDEVYAKGEDDALLLQNADKIQFIDSYIKGEADNLPNSKTNQSTTYKIRN
ncbi:MAG: hypothetical protein EZS28_020165 [Streblomastix strix]|uniref:Uncharacterized protein n=1 Tax=Streblomastix strix TaxID=222440 RepID=A0A5J4VP49_9EUKA|nr:MAG: hypothetical protein EZS28_020165 [Streblomastix strix]